MRPALEESLAFLASQAVQERFVVHGTRDKYLLPEELLESALHKSKQVLDQHPSTFKKSEIDALRHLHSELSLLSIPVTDVRVSSEDLILQNRAWSTVRDAARQCLLALGFDLAAWEAQELSKRR